MTVPQDLIERVRKATGPDRELDHALWLHFDATAKAKHASGRVPLPWAWCITSSVDDALALAERVLPGWRYDLHSPRMGQVFEAVLMDGDSASRRIVVAHAASAPLAIVLAILLALQSSEQSNAV